MGPLQVHGFADGGELGYGGALFSPLEAAGWKSSMHSS